MKKQEVDVEAASIEGVVNGEVFRWELTGPFIRFSASNLVSGTWRGETTVNGDEMIGRADGHLCPCTFHLRRVDTQPERSRRSDLRSARVSLGQAT